MENKKNCIELLNNDYISNYLNLYDFDNLDFIKLNDIPGTEIKKIKEIILNILKSEKNYDILEEHFPEFDTYVILIRMNEINEDFNKDKLLNQFSILYYSYIFNLLKKFEKRMRVLDAALDFILNKNEQNRNIFL